MTPPRDLPLTLVLTSVLSAALDTAGDRHPLLVAAGRGLAPVVPLRPRPGTPGPDRPQAA
ncbi:MAG: hypothetical protein HY830_19310 [Actinobacteria bacterium]|nr:hypothetical protein [Actinomycetota bacterium]